MAKQDVSYSQPFVRRRKVPVEPTQKLNSSLTETKKRLNHLLMKCLALTLGEKIINLDLLL